MKRVANKCLFLICALAIGFAACSDNKNGKASKDPVFGANPKLQEVTGKISNDPDNAALYYERGVLLHKIEQDSLALNDFKKAVSLDSSKAEYFSAIGELMFEHKDISGSTVWFEKALKLNPKDVKAQLKLAKLFVYIKQYTTAFTHINTVLRQDVYNPEAYFLKGMIYKDLKDTAKAISSFQTAIQVAPDYKDAMVQLGQAYALKGDAIALTYYNNAFKLDTTDVYPLFARGVFYQDKKEYELAKAEYRNALLHNRNYLDAYLNTGYILMQQDSLDKALRQYDIITKLDQTNAEGYYNRGLCYELMGKKQEAIADYKQALVFAEEYILPKEGLKRLGAQ